MLHEYICIIIYTIMKHLLLIFQVLRTAFFTSADPNLFGSLKRRQEKTNLANSFKAKAEGVGDDIATAQSANPFDSAATKSAMKKVSRGAKAMQNRFLNTMGAGASPEAIIAAQGAASEAVGSAAGEIASGAEANQKQEVDRLRGLKAGYEGQEASSAMAATNERGSGWKDAFAVVDKVAGLVEGVTGAV